MVDGRWRDGLGKRGVIMNRRAWGREHQIASLPWIPLAFDDGESLAGEVVVHRRADVAMRAINDIFRTYGDGGKEVARGSVGVSSAGVVEQVQAAAEVGFAQSRQFVQLLLHAIPWEVQRMVFDHVWTDQFFVGHKLRAVIRNRECAERTLGRCALVFELLGLRAFGERILVDDEYLHFLKQWSAAVG